MKMNGGLERSEGSKASFQVYLHYLCLGCTCQSIPGNYVKIDSGLQIRDEAVPLYRPLCDIVDTDPNVDQLS